MSLIQSQVLWKIKEGGGGVSGTATRWEKDLPCRCWLWSWGDALRMEEAGKQASLWGPWKGTRPRWRPASRPVEAVLDLRPPWIVGQISVVWSYRVCGNLVQKQWETTTGPDSLCTATYQLHGDFANLLDLLLFKTGIMIQFWRALLRVQWNNSVWTSSRDAIHSWCFINVSSLFYRDDQFFYLM